MDPLLFLLITMLTLSALQIILVVVHRSRRAMSWAAVNLVILAVGASALLWAPEWALILVGALFVPFVFMPVMLGALAQRYAFRNQPGRAARLFAWAAWFHPSRDNRMRARLHAALVHDDPETSVRALEVLAHAQIDPGARRMMQAFVASRRDDWSAVCDILGGPDADTDTSSALLVRALGETGRRDAMVRAFEETKGRLVGSDLWMAQLFVLSFTGRGGSVGSILHHLLKGLDAETKNYWHGIAELYATQATSPGSETLERLAGQARRATLRRAALRHVRTACLSPPEPISPQSKAHITTLERHVADQLAQAGGSWRDMTATLLLAITISAVFAVEVWSGGEEDLRTLVRMGAMWPPYVIENGEWWRLATATLLHAGWVHFIANLFVLVVLGRLVERSVGWWRMMVGYGVGAVFSSACVLATMVWGISDNAVLVGASGGLLALFGMEVARHIVAWRRSRDILDRRRVILLTIILLIQIGIDLSLPEISLTAHLSGFAVGLCLGILLRPPPQTSTARPDPPYPELKGDCP